MVKVEKTTYKEYGNCCRITNGKFEIIVTTDLGPRVIFYGKCGGENIMYEDHEDLINKGGEYFDENLAGKGIWHIYGGHRLWKSPEYIDTYYPDNAPVDVQYVEGGAVFTSEAEVTTGIRKSISITMQDGGEITLVHSFTNVGDKTTTPISMWGLTVLDKGAKAYIPLSQEDTGFLANRNIVLWPYTDVKDERLTITNDQVTLQQKNIAQPIKVGMSIKQAVTVKTKGLKFTLDFDYLEGERYPDYECNVESYTNNIMLEIETLSPLYELQPGETKTHVERWNLQEI